MGFNIRGGDKSSLALLSNKRGRAYARTKADEAFALPSFADAVPVPAAEPQRQTNVLPSSDEPLSKASSSAASLNGPQLKNLTSNHAPKPEQFPERNVETVKQTMLQHESVFKEQLHELHRLYQKQCVLMAESKKDVSSTRFSEPSSSNSSHLSSPRFAPSQDWTSLKNSDGVKTYEMHSVHFNRIGDVKHLENCGTRKNVINSHISGIHGLGPRSDYLFTCDKIISKQPIIDLERPAEELMDTEIHGRKSQVVGWDCKSDGFSSACGKFSISKEPENKTEIHSEECSVPESSRLFGLQLMDDTRMLGSLQGIEEMQMGEGQQKQLASNQSAFSKSQVSCQGSAAVLASLKHGHQSYLQESSSASGFSQALPDLNTNICQVEELSSSMHGIPEECMKRSEQQYMYLQGDSMSCLSTPQLPHWLRQATLSKSSSLHVSAEILPCYHKTSVFIPQFHSGITEDLSSLHRLHEEPNWSGNHSIKTAKDLAYLEPDCPRLEGTRDLRYGKISLGEPPSAFLSQIFHHSSVGAVQRSSPALYGRGYMSKGIPFFDSNSKETDPVCITGRTPNPCHDVKGIEFESNDPSVEPVLKIVSGVFGKFPAESLWYQQKESFSQLLQNPPSPGPFSNESSLLNPLKATSDCQAPVYGVDIGDGGIHIMNCAEESSPQSNRTVPSHTVDSTWTGRQLGGAPESILQVNQSMSIKPSETSLASSCKHELDFNSGGHFFDLIVDGDDFMPLDGHDISNANKRLSNANQNCCNHESESRRNKVWQPLNGSMEMGPNISSNMAVEGAAFGFLSDNKTKYLHRQTFYTLEGIDNGSSRGEIHRNDSCTGYCSGEDETEGGLAGLRSSDGSGLTSCESRDMVQLETMKLRDDSNISSSDACYSRELRISENKEDLASLPSLQRGNDIDLGCPVNDVPEDQCGSFLSPKIDDITMHHHTKVNHAAHKFMDLDCRCQAANVVTKKDSFDAVEAAKLLVSLESDVHLMAGGVSSTSACGKCLDWLADVIPDEDSCRQKYLSIEVISGEKNEIRSSMEHVVDSFEAATLALKPIDPDSECLVEPVTERGSIITENESSLRRRPCRKGRSGKDFRKDMFHSIISLSRHEITEDFQIIQGLVKSAAETESSSVPEDKAPSDPEQGCFLKNVKWKDSKLCKDKKSNGLYVCLWGGSTRRKRKRRLRNQWQSLPLGVRLILFSGETANAYS
ncbi:hypothetical protein KP509_06G055600 [Ceratopteris richardii]|uniref:Uncharacterized protein n=1 Tax=Ceratopteris richardii TaxID=49495 RepID=A0A8T2UG81_CERRI|nr:hypothetical protein KP509_06G055600 [Ceratopteris richardii]